MKLWNRIKQYPQIGLVVLAFIAFIGLGMPDGLLGVGWPSIRSGFGIPLDSIGMLLLAAVTGYMSSSFLSGFLLARIGVGRILAFSCLLTGLTLIGYTLVPHWWLMVLLGVAAGLGAGGIDAGLNTYVASHFSDRVMQWLHACWGVGITLGPLVMTLGLTSLDTWRFGYWVVGGFQLTLALCFFLTLPMWNKETTETERADNVSGPEESAKRLTDYKTPLGETLRHPQVWLSIILFFLYVGAEGGLGIWSYTLLTESRGVDATLAGVFTGSYWLTFTVGRITAGLLTRRLGVNLLVQGGLVGAFAGACLLLWNPAPIANVCAVALIGVSIAPIFPALMSGTKTRVGDKFAANTIGMQIAAAGCGSALIPGMMGFLARRVSLEIIPVCLVAVYIALFACFTLALRLSKKA